MDTAEHMDIVLERPGDIEKYTGQYPVGTIAHTEDLRTCYVWNGREWELC